MDYVSELGLRGEIARVRAVADDGLTLYLEFRNGLFTSAQLLIAQGMHARVVMEVLGHSQIAVTMNVYGHVLDPQMRDAADAVDDALWGDDGDEEQQP